MNIGIIMFLPHLTLNCGGKLLYLKEPVVMGILNLTPDSFFEASQLEADESLVEKAGRMLESGAAILDVGGISTRPGAQEITAAEELKRVLPAIILLKKNYPDALISVDTYRSLVAREAVTAGAIMINDISAGEMDEGFLETVAGLNVPYVLMHMQGRPQTMQKNPFYNDVLLEVTDFFIQKIGRLRGLGVKDIILDPGFGFGKTVEHNYRLLTGMHVFKMLEYPLLAGLSRKSMVTRLLDVPPENALNGTSVLNFIALQQGAKILRVHDVKEATEVIKIFKMTEETKISELRQINP